MRYSRNSSFLSAVIINLLLICVATVALTSGSTVAKYVMVNSTQINVVESAKFFFTSNYLSEDTPTHYVYDIGGADVFCCNYDINNIINTSAYSVDYDVKLTYFTDESRTIQKSNPKDIDGNDIPAKFHMKTEGEELQSSNFKIPFCPDAYYVFVEAISSYPYRKSLSAIIVFDVDITPSYYTVENGSGVVTLSVSVGTLPISELAVSWPSGYIPDFSSSLMSSESTDIQNSSAVLHNLSSNTVYRIDFFGTDTINETVSPVPFTDSITIK